MINIISSITQECGIYRTLFHISLLIYTHCSSNCTRPHMTTDTHRKFRNLNPMSRIHFFPFLCPFQSLFFCIRMPNKYTHIFSSVFLCKTLITLCNNIFNHFLCFFSSSYLAIRLNNSAMKLKDRFYIQKFSRLSG